ncbi:MAG TPA: cbb3-type cytochrome c oxidase subunit I [Solirubrobacterales bacterium]|jgi:heme/copper-type cytochrome/quinol oxidase subunit 1|nr:cbb3-type cytochrome c oxidase subunit I [Solirubrobacterales bacterium]
MSPSPRPELVADGYSAARPRWAQLATSADHKDVGQILITGALGFLFIALVELVLMRIQLLVPENTFLSPVAFNRMLSLYGATGVFLFALPLVFGLFYYVAPLQIGARGTALPRLGQVGLTLWVAGATVLYAGFLFTPSEAGVNPLAPLSEVAFLSNNGVDAWATATGLATLGFVLLAINLIATLKTMRAPGMAWRRVPLFAWATAVGSWLMVVIGPVLLAALTMLMIDRNYDGIFFADGSGGAPLLWQHLSWIFYTGTYMLILIFAFGAIAEIAATFSRKPIFNRNVVMACLAAIAVLGTLAWMQNMLTAPIGIGWMYFAMLVSLALLVPFGLVFFNLVATLAGGTLRMRAPLLFALGAIFAIGVGLASELCHSLVAAAWHLKNTTDSTAATHFALIGGAVFAGFAALHYWFPKMTGRTMGETLARISFWTILAGLLLGFVPLFFAGAEQGQVVDAYKYFAGTGVTAYNVIASIGVFVLFAGILLTILNAIFSRTNGPAAGHDPWGGDTLEWFTLSPPEPHNFDVLPDVRSPQPLRDIRVAIGHRTRRSEQAAARESQPVA